MVGHGATQAGPPRIEYSISSVRGGRTADCCSIIIHSGELLFMRQIAGIVGYRGYSGAELIRTLDQHAGVTPVLLDHREGVDTPAIRNRRGPDHLPCTAEAVQNAGLAVVFLATPPEVSMELAPVMIS